MSASSKLFLLVGETGVGKSSYINWLAGHEIVQEGHFYASETSLAATYTLQSSRVIDTSGLLDTNGLTEEDIFHLIQTEVLRQKQDAGFEIISGIILVLDGSVARIRVRDVVLSVIKMLGESCLNSLMIAINKFEQVPLGRRQQLLDYIKSEAMALGIDSNRVLAIDTKANLDAYYPALEERFSNLSGYHIDGLNELERRVEVYFQGELNNEQNYETYEESIPRIVERVIQETVMIDQHYTERCNCRRVCRTSIFGICVHHGTYCDTCHRTIQVPKIIDRVIQETIYDIIHHRRLRNEEGYYRMMARERVIQEVRNFVFQQRNPRDNNAEIDL